MANKGPDSKKRAYLFIGVLWLIAAVLSFATGHLIYGLVAVVFALAFGVGPFLGIRGFDWAQRGGEGRGGAGGSR